MTARVAIFALAAIAPLFLSPSGDILNNMVLAAAYVVMALGLNVIVGFAGLLDLGYVAFFAIGAYTAAYFGSGFWAGAGSNGRGIGVLVSHTTGATPGIHVNFLLILVLAVAATALIGTLIGIPTLRLRGDYIGIVTLAFGEIIGHLVTNGRMIHVFGGTLTAGPSGIGPIDAIDLPLIGSFGPLDLRPWYWFALALVALALTVNLRLRDSRIGRAWTAMREDEPAAASVGIPIVRTKLMAYATGAAFGGVAGAFFASYLAVVEADQFQFSFSLFILAMVVLGGVGSVYGVVLGAVVISVVNSYVLPKALGDLTDISSGVYGAILVAVMVLRPQGLIRARRSEPRAAGRIPDSDSLSSPLDNAGMRVCRRRRSTPPAAAIALLAQHLSPSRAARPMPAGRQPDPAPLAALVGLGAAVSLLLIVFAGRYGYHRDELYFLAAGRHLAWGFADQGPVTPQIAHLMDSIAPGSLTVLRLPSALMAGTTVMLTGLTARELGGSRRAQVIATSCAAVASVLLVVGHLLSTSTFDLLAWSAVIWLVARVIRTGDDKLLLAAGAVAGLALLNKPLIAFLLAAIGAGCIAVGPRGLLRSPWLWAGVLLAIAMWSPWLIWQAQHGWPQLDVSSSIAAGGSASSQPRWALLPFQFLLVSPVLAPIWIAGLVALLRDPRFRPFRVFAAAWLFLVLAFLATGGKPYYLAGMFPVLLAAGAIGTDRWLSRGATRLRAGLLWSMVALSGLVSATIALPLLPARDAGPVIAMNGDVGETIGWPELTETVASVYRRAGPPAVIFTSNYGEAGAIDRYGPPLGLPSAYSGHNAFGYWGPPPDRTGPVVTVGLDAAALRHFRGCHLAANIENAAGIDNDERGEPVQLCSGTRAPWSHIWRDLRHLG